MYIVTQGDIHKAEIKLLQQKLNIANTAATRYFSYQLQENLEFVKCNVCKGSWVINRDSYQLIKCKCKQFTQICESCLEIEEKHSKTECVHPDCKCDSFTVSCPIHDEEE